MNINLTQVLGRVTRDPELKALPSGINVCSFSIATNRFFTQNGEKKEETEFHNCVAFGKTADVVAQYVKKGSELYVQGRLSTKSWDDKTTGQKKYRTEIIADLVQLEAKKRSTIAEPSKSAEEVEADRAFDDGSQSPEQRSAEINADDIPF